MGWSCRVYKSRKHSPALRNDQGLRLARKLPTFVAGKDCSRLEALCVPRGHESSYRPTTPLSEQLLPTNPAIRPAWLATQ
jgi:hypothetical protein